MFLSDVLTVLQTNPLAAYTSLAALLLAAVALLSGWALLDFLPLFRAKGLTVVLGAVLLALLLSRLEPGASATLTVPANANAFPVLHGFSRLPLYVLALAYGPTPALVAAALFSGLSATTQLPGLADAVLALELCVLGWLAITPSPFRQRWAGPINVLLACLLSWSSAGVVLVEQLGYDGRLLASYWHFHRAALPGIAVSLLSLLLIGPQLYTRLFADSRIAPRPLHKAVSIPQTDPAVARATLLRERATPTTRVSPEPSSAGLARAEGTVPGFKLPALERHRQRSARRLSTLQTSILPVQLDEARNQRKHQLEPLELPPLH